MPGCPVPTITPRPRLRPPPPPGPSAARRLPMACIFAVPILVLSTAATGLSQEILRHDIHLRLWPRESRLEGDCTLMIVPPATEGSEISLQLLDGTLQPVEIGGRPVEEVRYEELGESTKAYDVRSLTIPLPMSDGKGPLEVRVRYTDDDFYATATNPEDNLPFSLGQIDQDAGSFASHLAWYPYLPYAGQSADISLTVPDDLVALSSGTLVETHRPEPGWITYRWHTDHGSGILPYPFAAHRYNMLRTRDEEGTTRLEIHYLGPDEQFAREKVAVLREIFAFYIDLFGSYPFEKLAVVETDLMEGNIGLAAQSMIMLSRKVWFAEPLDLDDTSLGNRPLLVLADEVAHQWNAYKVASPNYLAEGLSRYTDSLYMAHRAASRPDAAPEDGERVLGEQMHQTCASYLAIAAQVPDIAISDPRVTPSLYFIKGALALDLLRSRIGPQRFLEAMHRYFTDNTGKTTKLEDLAEAFQKTTGEDFSWHFEQWYRRAGHPRLTWSWDATPATPTVYTVNLQIEQSQQSPPYRLLLPLEVRDADDNTESTSIELTQASQSFSFMVNVQPSKITIDPQRRIPAEYTLH